MLNMYNRILQAVEDGRLICLPVFSRSDRVGLEPTVVYALRAGTRIRMPYKITAMRQVLRSGKLARRRRRKNNRVSIPPGPLVAEYVRIGRRSPLQEVLARNDPEELKANFIVIDKGYPTVKIFQFVKDISAALRQTDHIFARYRDELDKLWEELAELEERLRGPRKLSYEEGLDARVRIAAIKLRIAEIRQIGTDRAARDFALQFLARESFVRLQQHAVGLNNTARSVSRRRRGFRRDELLTYLDGLDLELAFFASKEVGLFRVAARREIRRIIQDEEGRLTNGEIVAALFRAGRSLTKATQVLARWSESLTSEEIQKSRGMRQLVTSQPTTIG